MFSVVSLQPLGQSSTLGVCSKCENPKVKRNPKSSEIDNGPDGEPAPGISRENQADRIKCVGIVWCSQKVLSALSFPNCEDKLSPG